MIVLHIQFFLRISMITSFFVVFKQFVCFVVFIVLFRRACIMIALSVYGIYVLCMYIYIHIHLFYFYFFELVHLLSISQV